MQATRKITVLFSALVAVFAVAASNASAQSIPAAEAQAFLGAWNLSVEGTPVEINIKNEDGQVAADLVVMGTTSKVTTITKSGESLNLRLVTDVGGQQAPVSIRLTPSGEALATVIDVADGAMTASATATKK